MNSFIHSKAGCGRTAQERLGINSVEPVPNLNIDSGVAVYGTHISPAHTSIQDINPASAEHEEIVTIPDLTGCVVVSHDRLFSEAFREKGLAFVIAVDKVESNLVSIAVFHRKKIDGRYFEYPIPGFNLDQLADRLGYDVHLDIRQEDHDSIRHRDYEATLLKTHRRLSQHPVSVIHIRDSESFSCFFYNPNLFNDNKLKVLLSAIWDAIPNKGANTLHLEEPAPKPKIDPYGKRRKLIESRGRPPENIPRTSNANVVSNETYQRSLADARKRGVVF